MLLPMLAALATINTFIYVFKVITKKEEEENKEKRKNGESGKPRIKFSRLKILFFENLTGFVDLKFCIGV
jgi:hypothetical protein